MPSDSFPEIRWTHLLYINGNDVNWMLLHQIIAAVNHYPLGTRCWLIEPLADRNQFVERIKTALLSRPGKSELLFCPVYNYHALQTIQGGLGLHGWIKGAHALMINNSPAPSAFHSNTSNQRPGGQRGLIR